MRVPTFTSVKRLIVYLLGAFLTGWGVWCFAYELLFPGEARAASPFVYATNMFCGVIVCWGVVSVLTTDRHCAGGLWTYLGAVVLGLSMILSALLVDVISTRRAQPNRLLIAFAAVAIVFQVGCFCVAAGHIRHRRKRRKSQATETLEAAAAPP
jgi:hypothetical protein